ncbi:MAG: phospho-N-acetylmuramoyl-pentapeptide-transferase [Clostridia bacterium]|nr:phospho-N-acetylmuramoyl-pentapeptide-transferase [Clostridia bacterium]
MSDFEWIAVAFVATFLLGMLIGPAVIKVATKLKAKQTILGYVEQHSLKTGTPTFGGLIFLLPFVVVSAVLGGFEYSITRMAIVVTLAYGLIGFLDDFLKVRFKENKGLKAYQKIIFQTGVAVFIAYFSFKNPFIGGSIALNFGLGELNLGYFYIPFAVLVYIAMSNAVNLTDGLDGLAGTTTAVYIVSFMAITLVSYLDALEYGKTQYSKELLSLMLTSASLVGGVVAFLWFNSHKAKIFMGDTGSLALGAYAGAQALFIKNPLVSVLVGIMPVISCISVIVQVASFKLRGKRVLLMAPLHHHLELKGLNESKIVAFYGIITLIAGVVSLLII